VGHVVWVQALVATLFSHLKCVLSRKFECMPKKRYFLEKYVKFTAATPIGLQTSLALSVAFPIFVFPQKSLGAL